MPNAPKCHRPQGLTPRAEHDRHRGTAHQRGYDEAWHKLARWFIEDQFNRGNFRCAECDKLLTGRRRDIHVDHIIAFHGLDDPLRLDPGNLQLLHAGCHSRKTIRVDGGWGRS